MNLFKRYSNWLETAPLVSRMTTTGIQFFTGDTLAQTVMEGRGFGRKLPWDYKRCFRSTCVGTFYGGPCFYAWFSYGIPAIQALPVFNGLGYWSKVAVGVSVDQTIWAYGINATIIGLFNFCEFGDLGRAYRHVRGSMYDVMIANWMVWPALSTINIGLVPIQFRVQFINFCAIWWNLYISWKNNKEKSKEMNQNEVGMISNEE